ncbi:LuxR C-terminal-related transcriptional regulator [Hydrocarboniphaga sp.]|uniref:LuxR C-terminal-related transcriptional regulator n=1 Tax=Hydrocarboniphaga sp. TaxID=2033016 RepID=UPI003D116A53
MIQVQQGLSPPFFAFAPVKTAIQAELTADDRPPVKLVSITAPTGYGKTVLQSAMYEHYRAAGAECHWLALDDRDVSVQRVLGHLETILVPRDGEVEPAQALHQGDESIDERIATLIEALALVSDPTVIFIDNLNYCTDETLDPLIDALVFRTPSWAHFVLSSTGDQSFDRARAKLEGRVRLVGFSDLSLSEAETEQLLGASLCARLSQDAVRAIVRQTEGWPAAVRLMQIILNAAESPEAALSQFSGADEDLAALLNRQVLQGFDAASRKFLLEISLLRTFGVNLSQHATGDAHAAAHIQRLLKQNVFVIPLDRRRSWYRLHSLFREFLIDEAQRQIPLDRRRQLLCRAAEWCEHAGRWQDAIDYALDADAAELAVGILERVAVMFVRDRGDLHQYIEWAEKLHAMGVRGGWEVDYWYVWALVFHRRYEYARRQQEKFSERIRSEADSSGRREEAQLLQRRIEVIGFAIDAYTDHLARAYDNGMRWLERTGGDDPFDVATIVVGSCFYKIGDFELVDARGMLRMAQSHIAQAQSSYGEAWVATATAAVQLHEGDFPLAHQDLLAALSKSKATLGDNAGITSTLALEAAKSAVEMGLDGEARDLLAMGMRRIQSHGLVDTAAFGLDAAIKLWDGAAAGGLSVGQFREIAAAYPPRLSLMLSCFLIRRLLRLGRSDEALAEAAQIGLVPERGYESFRLAERDSIACMRSLVAAVQIELDIVGGRLKQATALIAEETRLARADGRYGRLVELALDEAAVSLCSHNPAPAARHLARAVGLAAKRRYLRPFRDRGEMVAALVNETKSKDWGFALDEDRRFFAEICRGLPVSAGDAIEGVDASALAETPTARELELLSLVEAGLSNQQLADRLSVSVATVKWHLYNLYTKLGVSSRGAALARARALNLLVR